jgi:hypothetical protein
MSTSVGNAPAAVEVPVPVPVPVLVPVVVPVLVPAPLLVPEPLPEDALPEPVPLPEPPAALVAVPDPPPPPPHAAIVATTTNWIERLSHTARHRARYDASGAEAFLSVCSKPMVPSARIGAKHESPSRIAHEATHDGTTRSFRTR